MPAQLRDWRAGTTQHRAYEHIARRIRKLAGKEVRSAVDIGAGGLELTHALAHEFPQARIQAWDLFANGIEALTDEPRISLLQLDLNRLDSFPDAQFDVVACVAVLEHVLDPLALLRMLRAITAPGGLAYVLAPDVGSPARKILRGRWPYYDPDEHLTLPTLVSIRRAVAIAGGGRVILRRASVGYSLRYLLRFLRVPLRVPRVADVILPIPAGALELVWFRDGS